MEDLRIGTGKTLWIYALILSIIYLSVGIIEIFGGGLEVIPGDIIGGLVLLVTAATYMVGVRKLFIGANEGLSFVIGGLLLSGIFGALYLLMAGADGVIYLIGEMGEFSLASEIRPEIYISVLSLPLAVKARALTRGMSW